MSREFRVLITDRAWPDCAVERGILSRIGAEVVEAPQGDEATLVELARDADAIGTCWAHVTESVIRAAPRCRLVARFGIGLDNISVETATELDIPVSNVPDYCVLGSVGPCAGSDPGLRGTWPSSTRGPRRANTGSVPPLP